MKASSLVTFSAGVLVSVGIEVGSLTLFPGSNVSRWLSARPDQPALLLVDGCAVATLFGAALLARAQNRTATLESERGQMYLEHAQQIEATLMNFARLEERNGELQEALEAMTEEQERAEALRLKERAEDAEKIQKAMEQRDETMRRLEAQMASHAKQMEAVNLALQYHRAELTQLRQGVRALQRLEPGVTAHSPRLTPAEYEAISEPLSMTSNGSISETQLDTEADSPFALVSEKAAPFQVLTSESVRETIVAGVDRRLSTLSSIEPQRIATEERAG